LLVAVLATDTFSGLGLAEGMSIISQLSVQAISVVITVIWTAIASYVILKIAGVFGGLRVSDDDEVEGLDIAQHGERGYHNS
jgi:Amt family ammonium transporter